MIDLFLGFGQGQNDPWFWLQVDFGLVRSQIRVMKEVLGYSSALTPALYIILI